MSAQGQGQKVIASLDTWLLAVGSVLEDCRNFGMQRLNRGRGLLVWALWIMAQF